MLVNIQRVGYIHTDRLVCVWAACAGSLFSTLIRSSDVALGIRTVGVYIFRVFFPLCSCNLQTQPQRFVVVVAALPMHNNIAGLLENSVRVRADSLIITINNNCLAIG